MSDSSALFGRTCAVTITDPNIRGLGANAFEVNELRVTFSIKKNLVGKDPNTAAIVIYNLSEQRRAQVRKGGKVALEAGLGQSWGQIFVGDIRHFDHVYTGTDWETRLELKDGGRSFEFVRASESFKPGTKIATVLRRLAEATGLDTGNLADAVADTQGEYVAGHVAHGPAHLELERACRAAGYTYSVQDGKLQFLKVNTTTRNTAVVLGSESGLVGSPTYGAPASKGKARRLNVRSLLNPKLRCGGRVDLQAKTYQGLMKVVALTHIGDTDGGEWFTDIECLPL